jgi:hypothetical protein
MPGTSSHGRPCTLRSSERSRPTRGPSVTNLLSSTYSCMAPMSRHVVNPDYRVGCANSVPPANRHIVGADPSLGTPRGTKNAIELGSARRQAPPGRRDGRTSLRIGPAQLMDARELTDPTGWVRFIEWLAGPSPGCKSCIACRCRSARWSGSSRMCRLGCRSRPRGRGSPCAMTRR